MWTLTFSVCVAAHTLSCVSLSEDHDQMVSPLETLWIPCGYGFKKVHEEEWVQEAHASRFCSRIRTPVEEPKFLALVNLCSNGQNDLWTFGTKTLAMEAEAMAVLTDLQSMRAPTIYQCPWTTAGTLRVTYLLSLQVFLPRPNLFGSHSKI